MRGNRLVNKHIENDIHLFPQGRTGPLDHYKSKDVHYNRAPDNRSDSLFDNLPELIRPDRLSRLLGISKATIYDWKYRGQTRNVPTDLFYKLNRSLFIRTEVLKRWIISSERS